MEDAQLTDDEIDLINLMAKRIGFAEFRECSKDNDEAYAMKAAYYKVVEQINELNQPENK